MPQLGEIKKGREIRRLGTCKYVWIACETCGKERWVEIRKTGKPKNPLCRLCNSRKGGYASKGLKEREANPNWKGGRGKDGHGYIRILLYPDDLFYPMANKKGYVLEHRLVMAQHLGRCLWPYEVVHHKNGARDDNRPENLRLFTSKSDHTEYERRIRQLEKRVTLLEAENALLNAWAIIDLTA